MLRKFSGLALFVFFSVMLALLLLFNLLIETHIAVVTHVSLITCLGFLLDIEINFQISSGESFELSSIHLDQSCFSRDMFFEKHISESFRLVSLPILADSNLLYLSKRPKPVSDFIFFQLVRQVLHINCLAILWHSVCNFPRILLSCDRLSSSSWLQFKIPCSHVFAGESDTLVIALLVLELYMSKSSALTTVLVERQLNFGNA